MFYEPQFTVSHMLLVLSRTSLISALLPSACLLRLRRLALPARCLHRPASALPASSLYFAFPGTIVSRGLLTVHVSRGSTVDVLYAPDPEKLAKIGLPWMQKEQ